MVGTKQELAFTDQAGGRARHPTDRAFPHERLLLSLAALCALAALPLTATVLLGWTDAFDQMAIDLLHGGPESQLGPPWLREAVRDVTGLGGTPVLVLAALGAAGLLAAASRHRLALLLLGSAIGATILSNGLKFLIARPRPNLREPLVVTYTNSFPSGHALLTAAIILTIGGLLAFAASRTRERVLIVGVAVLVVVCVGLSRVYLGAHWPSDVLGGWLIGTAWAAVTLAAARRIDLAGR